mmetsp:Transcript_9466/g.38705  ORF Transcript_9466/g.38705 Transcript_9466/m.38705 type:complete len:411 (+) Transcript_9466:1052-2284(+)
MRHDYLHKARVRRPLHGLLTCATVADAQLERAGVGSDVVAALEVSVAVGDLSVQRRVGGHPLGEAHLRVGALAQPIEAVVLVLRSHATEAGDGLDRGSLAAGQLQAADQLQRRFMRLLGQLPRRHSSLGAEEGHDAEGGGLVEEEFAVEGEADGLLRYVGGVLDDDAAAGRRLLPSAFLTLSVPVLLLWRSLRANSGGRPPAALLPCRRLFIRCHCRALVALHITPAALHLELERRRYLRECPASQLCSDEADTPRNRRLLLLLHTLGVGRVVCGGEGHHRLVLVHIPRVFPLPRGNEAALQLLLCVECMGVLVELLHQPLELLCVLRFARRRFSPILHTSSAVGTRLCCCLSLLLQLLETRYVILDLTTPRLLLLSLEELNQCLLLALVLLLSLFLFYARPNLLPCSQN